MPLDHVSLGVKDVKKAKAFYDRVLATIGWKPVYPVEVNGALLALRENDTYDRLYVKWFGTP